MSTRTRPHAPAVAPRGDGGQRFYTTVHTLTLVNHVWWIAKANALTVFTASPLLVVLFVMPGSVLTWGAATVCGLSLGPSAVALFTVLMGLDRTSGFTARRYLRTWAHGWRTATPVWAGPWTVVCLASTNVSLGTTGTALRWANLLVLVVAGTFGVNALVLLARWPQAPAGRVLAVTAQLAAVRALRYNATAAVLLGTFVLWTAVGGWGAPFVVALAGAAVVGVYRPVLELVAAHQGVDDADGPSAHVAVPAGRSRSEG